MLEKIQKRVVNLVGPFVASQLQYLSHRCLIDLFSIISISMVDVLLNFMNLSLVVFLRNLALSLLFFRKAIGNSIRI